MNRATRLPERDGYEARIGTGSKWITERQEDVMRGARLSTERAALNANRWCLECGERGDVCDCPSSVRSHVTLNAFRAERERVREAFRTSGDTPYSSPEWPGDI